MFGQIYRYLFCQLYFSTEKELASPLKAKNNSFSEGMRLSFAHMQ